MTDNKPTSAETILNGVSAHTDHAVTQYDLLPKMIPHFDRHLVFPIIEDLEKKEDEDLVAVKNLKFELLKETSMTDYVADLEMEIKGLNERPLEYNRKREEVLQRQQMLETQTSKIMMLFDDKTVTSNLRSDKDANLRYLKEEYGVAMEDINLLYDHGQFKYSIGDYAAAAELLFQFRTLVCSLPQSISCCNA